jgi:hypothetical protein
LFRRDVHRLIKRSAASATTDIWHRTQLPKMWLNPQGFTLENRFYSALAGADRQQVGCADDR